VNTRSIRCPSCLNEYSHQDNPALFRLVEKALERDSKASKVKRERDALLVAAAHNLARKITDALKEEYEIGTSSQFCDECDWDAAGTEEIVSTIQKAMEATGVESELRAAIKLAEEGK
jgi:hypothetical protein